MQGCSTLRTKVFQALNPAEPRQTWMLRALTCLISVNSRELSAYLRMEWGHVLRRACPTPPVPEVREPNFEDASKWSR